MDASHLPGKERAFQKNSDETKAESGIAAGPTGTLAPQPSQAN